MPCPVDLVPVGLCTSGRRADCMSYYTIVKCCAQTSFAEESTEILHQATEIHVATEIQESKSCSAQSKSHDHEMRVAKVT